MDTLSAPEDAITTSQNCRRDFTPDPRFEAQTAVVVVRFARVPWDENATENTTIAARESTTRGRRTGCQSSIASGTRGPIAVMGRANVGALPR